jgi:hypothetical protein
MAAAQVFEVVQPPANSSITVSHFIRCHGGIVPEWVPLHAKPYQGEIPRGRPIFEVNVAAEMAERAEFMQPVANDDQLLEEPDTIAYLRKKTGRQWSQQDFDQRQAVGFPDPYRPGSGVHGLPDLSRVFWSSDAIDRWIEAKRADLARLERLVGGKR